MEALGTVVDSKTVPKLWFGASLGLILGLQTLHIGDALQINPGIATATSMPLAKELLKALDPKQLERNLLQNLCFLNPSCKFTGRYKLGHSPDSSRNHKGLW